METFFGKRSLLINIKIKAVMNKNIFYAIFRFISLNHIQAKFFYKILREKESYMVKVGKQDTFKIHFISFCLFNFIFHII